MTKKISRPSKETVLRESKDYLMIALGMILYGIGWTLFLLPNKITVGGILGWKFSVKTIFAVFMSCVLGATLCVR